MGDSILWKYWLWWSLFASPAVPLVFAWRRVRLDRRAWTRFDLVQVTVATVSSLWMDALVANWWFLAPAHSGLRSAILGGNLAAVLFCGVLSFLASFSPVARIQRLATALACLMLVLEWGQIGILTR